MKSKKLFLGNEIKPNTVFKADIFTFAKMRFKTMLGSHANGVDGEKWKNNIHSLN